MKRLLRIADTRNRIFLSMPEVLAALPTEAATLRWRILDLGDVVATDESGLNVLDLEERVVASSTGLALSFEELASFASSTLQVIDGLFVVPSEGAPTPQRADDDVTILDRSELVLAAFDSTFWLVGAEDALLDGIKTAFADVTEEDPASTPLRAWGPSAG